MRITLSLFNGIGTGIQALKNLNIAVEQSYVSEIDKFANQTNMKNHPESIQLGDVTKWREWDIDWSRVDLVTGGFPCQAWSMAGQQMGDKDPRGALFWTTLEVISQVLRHNREAKWLMENVKMKREFEEYITFHTMVELGHVEKVLINSALLTAQNRNRYYWSNFKIEQPEDRGILLRDIVECGEVDREKSLCISTSYSNGVKPADYFEKSRGQLVFRDIESMKTNNRVKGYSVDSRGVRPNKGDIRKSGISELGRCLFKDSKTDTLTTSHAPKIIEGIKIGALRGRYVIDGVRQDHKGSTAGKTTQRLEIRSDEKSNTLTTVQKDNVLVKDELHYRKLTPLECERLQGYPDGYTEGVSNTQRYKQCGNGWTLPVIEHIFKEMLK